MTTLRQVVGSHDLQEMIVNRESVALEILNVIQPPALEWGVTIESLLIKDIQFSVDLQENLSAAAKQRRLGTVDFLHSSRNNHKLLLLISFRRIKDYCCSG